MNYKKYLTLFVVLAIFVSVLFLLSSRTSLATIDSHSGCSYSSDIKYSTGCNGEGDINIGGCYRRKCGPYDCRCDENGENCDTCYHHCRECSCSGSWDEYRCSSSDCGGDIKRIECSSEEKGSCSYSNCGSGEKCCVECDSPETCEECQSWQKPIRDGSCDDPNCGEWCFAKPECKCCGDCIEAPQNPQYYQSPFYDIAQPSADNVYLPVRLDWDDVPGWWEGWGGGIGRNCESGGKICYDSSSAGRVDWDAYHTCEDAGITSCMQKVEEKYPNYTCWGEVQGFYLECLRNYKKKNCEKEYTTDEEGCTLSCPALENEETCYPPSAFVQSYVIQINGDLRDCGALKDIAKLEGQIEASTDPAEKNRLKDEIETIRETRLNISSYTEVLESSEFIPPCSCMFRSNRTYDWQVKACCSPNGTNCGPWSNWQFTTSPAPEPKSPYDPDWAGDKKLENVSFEKSRKLKWCEIEDPKYYEETAILDKEFYKPLSYKISIYYWDKDKKEYLCHPLLSVNGKCPPFILSPDFALGERLPADEFWDKELREAYFTKKTSYAWKAAACKDAYGEDCSDYSQLWKFETADWDVGIWVNSPANDSTTPIGLPVLLKWSAAGANSFNYKILKGGATVKKGWTRLSDLLLSYGNPLELDTVYGWQVQPCWDYEAKDCQDDWGGPWYFRTTGVPPELKKPTGSNIIIPAEFTWKEVAGAKSYVFQIQGGGESLTKTVPKPPLTLVYPELKQETQYTWQVKTCAQPQGSICGSPASATFTTFKLGVPANPNPGDGGEIYTYKPRFSWKSVEGAKSYQYTVTLTKLDPEDPKKECADLVGEKIIDEAVTTRTSASLPLTCWGEYQWQVKACLDKNCQETGDDSPLWTFNLIAGGAPTGGWALLPQGLVPCGLPSQNPSRPWVDETEPCQIKHIFILLFIVMDFLFVKVVPLVLILLALASGVIFYFSLKMGASSPVAKVKSLWKAAGIGLLLILFAWTITSFFLTLFDYQVGIFGPWWQI